MSTSVRSGVGGRYVRTTNASPTRFNAGAASVRDPVSRGSFRVVPQRWLDTRLNVSTLEPPAESKETEHVMWFDKFPENWTHANSENELLEILQNETERMIFIDFYAGFCGACRAAFPQLSRVAGNPDFQKDFLFVKCCVTDKGVRDFVRKHGITGIPTAMVCSPGGEKLISFGASFRKINAVKANLIVLAANRGASFIMDPNGYVIPRPEAEG